MYDCCPCCEDRKHIVGHADPCSRHQRGGGDQHRKTKEES